MNKDILYRYVKATASQEEEKAVLEYITDPEHLEELREVQRKYEAALMCAPVINRLHENRKTKSPKRKVHVLRTVTRIITAAAAVVAVGIFAWNSFAPKQEDARLMSYSNVVGKSRLTLPDGTVAWLHSNSTLEYTDDFGEEFRKVTLKGEAYFDVAKNQDCPFIIDVDRLKIKVVGTSFNVASGDEGIDVSLVEGQVRLETGDSTTMDMTAGHIAHFDRETKTIEIEEGNAGLAAQWAQERIVFHGQPLKEICEVLEIWYGRKIHIEPSAPSARLSFTITTEPLESVLAYIQVINPAISYKVNKDSSVRIY